jgi:hypothetical protein
MYAASSEARNVTALAMSFDGAEVAERRHGLDLILEGLGQVLGEFSVPSSLDRGIRLAGQQRHPLPASIRIEL